MTSHDQDRKIEIGLARERLAAVRKYERLLDRGFCQRDAADKLVNYSFNMLRRWQMIYGIEILNP